MSFSVNTGRCIHQFSEWRDDGLYFGCKLNYQECILGGEDYCEYFEDDGGEG